MPLFYKILHINLANFKKIHDKFMLLKVNKSLNFSRKTRSLRDIRYLIILGYKLHQHPPVLVVHHVHFIMIYFMYFVDSDIK